MVRVLLFNLLYLGCCGYALWRGRGPERWGALILIADFQLSHLLVGPVTTRFAGGVEWPVFWTDLTAFLALYGLSIASTRFWPIWIAGIQLVVTLSHLAPLSPRIIPWAASNAVGLWGYPLLLVLAIGAHRAWSRRQREHDPSWSWQLDEARPT